MIGLGGAIGTGLFMGSGIAIGYAGPAVVVSYAIAGFIALVMVFSLSEMAVVHPAAGSFGVYAETYLNPWVGLRRPLHLLDRAGDRHRRRSGRRRHLHDLLVSRGAGVGLVARLRVRPALRERALGGQLRHVRVLVRDDQGGRRSCCSSSSARSTSSASACPPSAFTISPGCPAASCRTAWRGVWMAVIMGVLLLQRHRSHRRDVGRDPRSGQGDSGSAAHHAVAVVPLLHPGAHDRRRPSFPGRKPARGSWSKARS